MTSVNCVYDALVASLSPKGRGSGWQKFNAVCCSHNGGHRQDTKGRGGILSPGNGEVVYHCFNCGYKTGWKPGRNLGTKMKNILQWAGVSHSVVKKLEFDVWLLKESMTENGTAPAMLPFKPKPKMDFKEVSLPTGAKHFREWIFEEDPPKKFLDVLSYASTRLYGDILSYDLYWTPIDRHSELKVNDLSSRLIIPFRWENKVVGWTGRLIRESKAAKYFSSEPHDYMFNTEVIDENDRYIFIAEGPLDALAIDGVGMLGDRCSAPMAEWLNGQDKEIIVVPDRMNRGGKLVDIAIENGWYVTFPEWGEGIKDACDSVHKFGKLFTVQSIIEYATKDKIKINVSRNIKLK